jgi:hypothetical protein
MSGFSFGGGSGGGTGGGFSFGSPAVTTASTQPTTGTGTSSSSYCGFQILLQISGKNSVLVRFFQLVTFYRNSG